MVFCVLWNMCWSIVPCVKCAVYCAPWIMYYVLCHVDDDMCVAYSAVCIVFRVSCVVYCVSWLVGRALCFVLCIVCCVRCSV